MNTPSSSITLVLVASFIGSFGGVFLKAGAHRLDRKRIASVLLNWRLGAGIASFLLSSVFFVLALREGELSILYPMVSLGYLWTLIWSRIFFGEPFTRTKFLGIGLILGGIAILQLGR